MLPPPPVKVEPEMVVQSTVKFPDPIKLASEPVTTALPESVVVPRFNVAPEASVVKPPVVANVVVNAGVPTDTPLLKVKK